MSDAQGEHDHGSEVADRARLGALTAGLVHNLNNMLAPILMSVDLLRSDETDPDTLELLDAIDEAATRAARTVREVNELARPARTGARSVGVVAVVQAVVSLIDDTFPRRVEVVRAPMPAEIEVHVDPWPLQAFLVDRCLESLGVLDDGGSITVGVERPDPNGPVCITVTDSGASRPDRSVPAVRGEGLDGAVVDVVDEGRSVVVAVPVHQA